MKTGTLTLVDATIARKLFVILVSIFQNIVSLLLLCVKAVTHIGVQTEALSAALATSRIALLSIKG